MIIMSVDYGDARTGIAICDSGEILASPVCTIHERNEAALIEKIAAVALERKAELIVVGLPKNMDSSEGERAQKSRNFAERLSERTGLPFEMYDERCTTVVSAVSLNFTNTRGKKRKAVIDSLAAVVILEDFLKKRHASLG